MDKKLVIIAVKGGPPKAMFEDEMLPGKDHEREEEMEEMEEMEEGSKEGCGKMKCPHCGGMIKYGIDE